MPTFSSGDCRKATIPYLSERGSNLSQGQRQLLTIARAVLADPAILVLDEATSSVDTRTEIRIQQALQRLMEGRTSFVIAHRLSTIRNADQVLVINHGEIIEQGNHTQLLAAKGFYHDLYLVSLKVRFSQLLSKQKRIGCPYNLFDLNQITQINPFYERRVHRFKTIFGLLFLNIFLIFLFKGFD